MELRAIVRMIIDDNPKQYSNNNDDYMSTSTKLIFNRVPPCDTEILSAALDMDYEILITERDFVSFPKSTMFTELHNELKDYKILLQIVSSFYDGKINGEPVHITQSNDFIYALQELYDIKQEYVDVSRVFVDINNPFEIIRVNRYLQQHNYQINNQ